MVTIIRDAPFTVFLAMVGVPLAMAAVAAIAGWHARGRAQLVSRTKSAKVGMAEDGYRTFEGTTEAIAGETVRAPLTGAECVWYSAKVEHWTRVGTSSSNRRNEWRTVRSTTSSAPFFVRDQTGVCAVNVFGAEVTPTDRSMWTGASLEPDDRNPPRVGPTQSTHGMVQIAGGPNSHYRYSEERIYAGDPVTVLGVFKSHRFDARDLDDLPSELPVDLPPSAPAHLETAPAPAVDAAADATAAEPPEDPWDTADRERQETLAARALEVTKAEIEKGGRGQPLVITTVSAAAHTAMMEMGSQAAFMVALVPLGIAVWVVVARFG